MKFPRYPLFLAEKSKPKGKEDDDKPDDSEDEKKAKSSDKKKPPKKSKDEIPSDFDDAGDDSSIPSEDDPSPEVAANPNNPLDIIAPHPYITQYPIENPDEELVGRGNGPPFSGAVDTLAPSRRGKGGERGWAIPIQENRARKRREYWFYRIDEVITDSTPLDTIIHDIVHSKNPRFDGKTKKERINIALGIFYKKHPSGKLNENADLASFTESAKEFLTYATAFLDLDHTPKIRFKETTPGQTFATWCPEEITIAVTNRHPMDVFRSLAHELVHQKQHENNVLHAESGQTGSEHENEANATAGVIMRNFAKLNPQFFGLSAINESKFSWQIGRRKDRKPRFSYQKSKKPYPKSIRETRALINKSKESGIEYGILAEVYDRGIRDWDRNGKLTQEQTAFGRVNSFISGGKASNLDKDLLNDE